MRFNLLNLFVLCFILLTLLVGSPFAFTFSQGDMNSCLCKCGCGSPGCYTYDLACFYHPGAYGGSPSCANASEGVCVCEGFGCWRAPISTNGTCYDDCQREYAAPVCGDNNCEQYKDESCAVSGCTECSCGVNQYCDPKKYGADARGCLEFECGDGSCNGTENNATCPYDCTWCGDGMCQLNETLADCPQDCYRFGDGECTEPYENYLNSPGDCPDLCGNGICEDFENDTACYDDCKEICDNGADDDNDGMPDCRDSDCQLEPYCRGFVVIHVTTDLNSLPMKRAFVSLYLMDQDTSYSSYASGYTDNDGYVSFRIDNSKLTPPVFVRAEVDLRDEESTFEIYYNKDYAGKLVTAKSVLFQLPWEKPFEMVLSPDSSTIDPAETDSEVYPQLTHLAYIYYNMQDIARHYREDMGYSFDTQYLPLKVFTFETVGAYCTACYSSTNYEIHFDEEASVYTDPSAPENREWHEFTHHLMTDMYEGFPPRLEGEGNHAGYKNNRTLDSLTESFAELWPAVYSGDNDYAGYKLTDPYQAWGKYGTDEELAFLTTQWELKDSVFVGPDKMWQFYLDNKPRTIKEYYEKLIIAYPEKIAVINDTFIRHGLFRSKTIGDGKFTLGEPCWDLNGDGDCEEPGEFIDLGTPPEFVEGNWPYQVFVPGQDEVLTPSNYQRPLRESRPYYDFNFVKLNVRDAQGNPITDAQFTVTYLYYGNCEGSDHTIVGVMKQGRIYLDFPPDKPACRIVARLTPQNYQSTGSIEITAAEQFQAMANWTNPQYPLEKNVTVGDPVTFCREDGKCTPGESSSCHDCALVEPSYACFRDADCNSSAGSKCYTGKCLTQPPVGATCNYDSHCDAWESKDCPDCKGGPCGCPALFIIVGALFAVVFLRQKKN